MTDKTDAELFREIAQGKGHNKKEIDAWLQTMTPLELSNAVHSVRDAGKIAVAEENHLASKSE